MSSSTIATVFGTRAVQYTFVDYQGGGALSSFADLRLAVAASAVTGTALNANTAVIGNFNLYPSMATDATRPSTAIDTGGRYTTIFGGSAFAASGANMANEALIPGSPDFRMPLASVPASARSSAPNFRSSLATLPLTRLSFTSAMLPQGARHVPYVSRFNPFGNAYLYNGTAPNGQPARIFDAAHGTAGQLLSRGDFKAQVAHYRARGADGVQQFGSGVVGYTIDQSERDIADGWHIPQVDSIFANSDARPATIDTVVVTDGLTKSIEDAGVMTRW